MKSKLPDVGTTIFSIMTRMAIEEGAINLSQGFPGFDCDPDLKRLVSKYMGAGRNQYAPSSGVPELLDVLSAKYSKLYRANIISEDITITAGGTEAIYTAITAVVNNGDEVIVFDPAYDCYDPAIRLNGGIPVHMNLTYPDFAVPWDEVNDRVNERTKLIIINTPHNPSGAAWTDNDYKNLEKVCTSNGIYVLSDEVYEHITFDKKHTSVLDYEALEPYALGVYSFGKTYHNTGWKIGYAVSKSDWMKEFKKVHQFLVFSCNTPMQYALSEYVQNAMKYLELPGVYREKRDVFLGSIKASRFKPLKCDGTYFQLLDYSEISNESDVKMAERLTREFKIASIPISVFYQDGTDNKALRFCFAKDEQTLKIAGEVLCKI